MPLGASRVQGFSPWFESYRYELWKDLIDGGWDFDYIGTETEMGSYPNYKGISFDPDHQGRGGWTSGQILNSLESAFLETGMPDIVLFSSPGGNDVLDGLPYENVIENVNDIIDLFQDRKPDIVILIEQLAPGKASFMTPELTAIFNQVILDVKTIAQEQTDENSQVIPVNMFDGFVDRYLSDNIHYNEEGAEFIAQRYYEALETILE
jgi:lysophospholipase L1-like esterase